MSQFFTDGVHPSVVVLFIVTVAALVLVLWRYRLLLILKWWYESGADAEEVTDLIEAHESKSPTANPFVNQSPLPPQVKLSYEQAIRAARLLVPLILSCVLLIVAIALGVFMGLSLASATNARSESTVVPSESAMQAETQELSATSSGLNATHNTTIDATLPDSVPTPSAATVVSVSQDRTQDHKSPQPINVSYWGISDKATEIIYLIDASHHMNGRPIQAAFERLDKSIEQLSSQQQIQVQFFYEITWMQPQKIQTIPRYGFNFRRRFTQPRYNLDKKQILSQAKQFVTSGSAFAGYSDSLSAVQYALKAKPDVIFLVTVDESTTNLRSRGRQRDRDLKTIQRLNVDGVKIHCIQIGTPQAPRIVIPKSTEPDSLIRSLADDSGGKAIRVEHSTE